jgi:hypothetical protein
MNRLRSGVLAAWTSAWWAGNVGPDEVVDAVTGADAPHQVEGYDGLRDLLVQWRRSGASVRLVLPAAGDLRGVPGPMDFRAAALDAGEAVCGSGLAIVPDIVEYFPSSAPTTVNWRAFAIDTVPPDVMQLGDVQYELTTAIRECASALNAADVAGSSDDISSALAQARRAGEFLELPPGYPPRAVALLSQAERLQSVLGIAGADELGGAVDRFGMAARRSALRPLETAVRRARLAGYNAGFDEFSD